jgi:peptidoglycan-N-acetylglucosamine deacetylase
MAVERTGRSTLAAGAVAAAAWSLPAPAPHVPAACRALRIHRRAALAGAVGLTFDDGPHAFGTPAVLDVLAAHGATATFFCVGEQVRRTGALLAEIVAAGHVVAVHGDRHRCLLALTPRVLSADLDRAADALGSAACALHRAPYGVYSAAALLEVRRRGWSPLLWSRWGRDWRARATPGAVASEVTRELSAGDVLLLHDADDYSAPGSWRTTVAALPEVLGRIAAAGLEARAVGPSQLGVAGR